MNLERYWAKPDKTNSTTYKCLLTRLETLKTMCILTQMFIRIGKTGLLLS